MPGPGYRFLVWETQCVCSKNADMKTASPSDLPSGRRKPPRRSGGLRLGLLAVLAGGCAAVLTFFFFAGDWPDVRAFIAADAQSVRQDRGDLPTPPDGDAGQAVAMRALNSVAQQADAWGMKTCLPQIVRISDFLTAGQSYTALSQHIDRDVGEGSFSSTIIARDQTGFDTISTLVSVPVGDEACPSSYQTVAAFDGRCGSVRVTHFATFTEELAFGDRVQARHDGQGSYAYFLPFGSSGCVVVKTQMLN